VFSFHPLQTFPRDFSPAEIVRDGWTKIYFGVDGPPQGLRVARTLAREIGGETIVIRPELREFYHAACVVASNHLTALLWVLERMFEAMNVRAKGFVPVFRPIIAATLRNIARTGPARALSGPVARGGVETIEAHVESIKRNLPEIIPYFLAMTAETARLAREKGSITESQYEAMLEMIRSQNHEQFSSREIH
jgi:predicted short-subunit dehydrogenase-like oxidoreductase (DUF2520 family)